MLKGLKVLQFQGLAPSVFCGFYFADQGAQVILVSRPDATSFSMQIHKNIMNRNKNCITLSLKDQKDKLIEILKNIDIVIDPFRPGILQKQKLGPNQLYKINKRIVLLRVSGYGQKGQMSLKPGHDLNYIASSGILKLINGKNKYIQFPTNYIADFVSASLGITGVLKALQKRKQSEMGYVVDCSLAQGCSYLTRFVSKNQKQGKRELQNRKVEYIEVRNRRYVVTFFQNQQKLVNNEQVLRQIQRVNKNGEIYFKSNVFQIAEIKKIKKIQQTYLPNPFLLKHQPTIINKIPQKDQNRQEILKKYGIADKFKAKL